VGDASGAGVLDEVVAVAWQVRQPIPGIYIGTTTKKAFPLPSIRAGLGRHPGEVTQGWPV
jgi:hypothetical protein